MRFGVEAAEVEALPAKVQALFSAQSATIREHRTAQIRAARSAAGRHAIDTGSPEAQIAADTAKISQLSAHMAAHRHDVTVRRALDRYINKRRKLLKYLRSRNPQSYFELVKRLGLRDIGA
jgi:small subunit ribosomal protein S15